MKKLHALAALVLSVSFFACSDDEGAVRNCSCHANPVEFSVGGAKVYLPNIFSPDGDGVNDQYVPFGRSDIAEIEEFVIRKPNNDILFLNENFATNMQSEGWDAIDGSDKFLGDFKFSIRIRNVDGMVATFDGTACSFVCDEGAANLENVTNCKWGTQHNGEGGFDETASSLESELGDCL